MLAVTDLKSNEPTSPFAGLVSRGRERTAQVPRRFILYLCPGSQAQLRQFFVLLRFRTAARMRACSAHAIRDRSS